MSDAIRRAMDEKQVLRRPERDGRMQAFSEAARQRKVRDALDNPLKAGSETTMRWHLMLVEVEAANRALTTRVAQLEEWQTDPRTKRAIAEARIELLTQAVLEASRRVMGGEGACPHDVGHEKAAGQCEHDWADWFEMEAQRTLDMFQRTAEEVKAEKETTSRDTADADAGANSGAGDRLYDEAVRAVLTEGRASISWLQHRFTIGAVRALRLVDAMVTAGVIGPYRDGNGGLLLTLDEWDARREGGG